MTCYFCQKIGHFSASCRARRRDVAYFKSENAQLDSAFLDTLGRTAWTVDVTVNGVDLNFKVDTGAEVTAISEAAFQSLGKVELLKPKKILLGATSVPLHVIGQINVTLKHGNCTCQHPVYVVRGT